MNKIDQRYLPVFGLLATLVTLSSAFALVVDDINILKISAQDQRAIIKKPDGKMLIIRPGDSLGTGVTVAEIAADRVVIEEKKGNGDEIVIIRLVDGKQKIEQIEKTAEGASTMRASAEKEKKGN
jgi:hypothetical protein